jgi:hypothetical protein
MAKKFLSIAGVSEDRADHVLELLFWFGFLGVLDAEGEERYAYQFQHGVKRMLTGVPTPFRCVIQPAFRRALGCTEN